MRGSQEKMELLKYRLASRLEAQKWRNRKEEIAFLEAGLHMRSLNQIMWQVPSMAIAITGGIWYGVTTLEDGMPKILALCFAAVFDILTIVVVCRMRCIVGDHIKKQDESEIKITATSSKKSKDDSSQDNASKCLDRFIQKPNIVVICWSLTLLLAALLSLGGAFFTSSLTTKTKPQAQPQQARCKIDLDLDIKVIASMPVATKTRNKIASSTHQCK